MMPLKRFQVGMTAYAVIRPVKFGEPITIEEWIVTAVGRKYVSAKRPGDSDYQIQKFCCQDEFDTYLAPNYMRRIRLFPTKEGAEEDTAKDKIIARIRDRIDRVVWDRYDLMHLIAIQELLEHK